MCFITQHSQHIYKSEFSAVRAGRNAIGEKYLVNAPELGSRFNGCITIIADMVSVEPCVGGWHWVYTFVIDDVIVRVRETEDTLSEVRYAAVAHWKSACTPTHIAYCYRNGVIEIGTMRPLGVFPLFTGPLEELESFISARARLAYDNNTMLVPGVPEAGKNTNNALDAVVRWREWCLKVNNTSNVRAA